MNIRQTKYVIGIAAIALGIGIVVTTTLPKSTQYYVTVDELRAEEMKFSGKEIKVAGKVVAGSVVKSDKDLLWEFKVANAGQVIPVTYKGAMPDTFKDGADVVVTGKLKQGELVATNVLAKCASRYEEKLQPGYESQPKVRS